MTGPDVRLLPAAAEQKPVLAQLLELYAYDFSFFRSFDVDDHGRYGYDKLDLHWSDPNRFPFLIWVDKKLAGFALVEKMPVRPGEVDAWDVAEFFVLPRFRRKGVGVIVAEALWTKLPGTWQVRIIDQNLAARAFWDRTIAAHLGARATPVTKVIQDKTWVVYEFLSRSGP